MTQLIVNPGTESAWEIPLQPGVISLGRGPENTFPIEHPSVSSAHCQLTVTDSGVVIKDLGSINGTFINDAMVDEAPLTNGQTVRLGDVVLQFESDQIPRARPIPGVVVQPLAAAACWQYSIRTPPAISVRNAGRRFAACASTCGKDAISAARAARNVRN